MKRVLLGMLLSASLLLGADATGRWNGTAALTRSDGEQRTVPMLLILKQDGTKITGTGGRDDEDRHDVLEGKIEGNVVTVVIEAGDYPIKLTLTINGEELSGDGAKDMPDGQQIKAKVTTKREKS